MNHTVDHKFIQCWIYIRGKINGKMCKIIKNEKFTEKMPTESCCTQKWEQSNLSALQIIIGIKMVLFQGCTQNISTFLCLIVHEEVVTVEVVSSRFGFAALWIPWCEEHLPLHAEQFLQCPGVSECASTSVSLGFHMWFCWVLQPWWLFFLSSFFFLKLLSPAVVKWNFSLPCFPGKLKAFLSSSPSVTNKVHLLAVEIKWSLWFCSVLTWFAADVTFLCVTLP